MRPCPRQKPLPRAIVAYQTPKHAIDDESKSINHTSQRLGFSDGRCESVLIIYIPIVFHMR